jgi:hypothetical protein
MSPFATRRALVKNKADPERPGPPFLARCHGRSDVSVTDTHFKGGASPNPVGESTRLGLRDLLDQQRIAGPAIEGHSHRLCIHGPFLVLFSAKPLDISR